MPLIHKAFSTTVPKAVESTGSSGSSGSAGPKRRITIRSVIKYTALLAGSTVVGVFVLTGVIFLHDAFTYTEKVSNFFLCRRSTS